MRLMAATLSLVFALLAKGALAQTAPLPPPSPSDEEVVVEGQRSLHDMIVNFVDEISATPSSENQLARWDHRICPGVIGLHREPAQFMADRIAQHAFEIGLDAGQPGCRANIIVFVTPDANVLAREFVDEYKQMMAARRTENTNTRGAEALEDFANTSRPVRWWHVASTVAADGFIIGEPSEGHTPQIRVFSPSRLQAATRQDFSRVIIIVDARRAQGLTYEALADYVSMVALAQISIDADASEVPSILNLFADQAAGRTPQTALTEWDKAYLEGLYGMTRNGSNAHRQEHEITRRMTEAVTTAPTPTQPAPQPSTTP